MSDSKNKKASKTNAKTSTAQTVQLDFLPKRVLYPAELETATEPVVVVMEEDEKHPGIKVPKTYVLISSIVNLPTKVTRYSPEKWAEQMESFRSTGIRQAIDLRPVEGGGFWVEEGRHRILGALEMGRRYIKADIDTSGTPVTSAVWRLEANAKRVGDRPIDIALGYEEMMDPKGANLTQEQVAEWGKVSPASVSRTLRLLEIPRDLADLVGSKLDAAWLEPIFSIREHIPLRDAASSAVVKAAERGHVQSAEDVHRLMTQAWMDTELALREDSISTEILEDPAWAKTRGRLKPVKVKVPDRYSGKPREVVYLCDVQAAVKAAQEVSDRLEAERKAEEERLRKKAAKQGKRVTTKPDGRVVVVEPPAKRSLAERVPEQRTKVQLDLLARFVPAQLAFPAEMLGEVLGRFVEHTPTLMALQDIEAACRALGRPVPDKEHGSRAFRFSRSDFVAAWKRDLAQGWRWVAVALFFQARDASKALENGLVNHYQDKDLAEPHLPVWLTGKTFEEATEIAKQALKDRDAGFKPVVDGEACDHCGEPATLRKEGVNVCRSEVFKGINKDPKALATLRLRRKEEAKAKATEAASASPASAEPSQATAPVEPAAVEASGGPMAADTPTPAGGADGSAEQPEAAVGTHPPAEPVPAEVAAASGKRRLRKGKAAAGA